jgi:hypothetical protein
MSNPRDGWDADEREALDGLEGELAEIRRRHQDDPSLAMLRAADADALPPDLQARVARHLQDSKWSQALVHGLRDAGADDRLDAESEHRLFHRITREAQAAATASSRQRWKPAMLLGGLAVAATLLIAVVVSRPHTDTVAVPGVATPSREEKPPSVASTPAAPSRPAVQIAYSKPEVKLSPSALTWRGDASANPFLRDLAPAFEAYRAGDYASAGAAFDRLSTVYPDAVEVLFYQGVSRMLAGNDAGAIAPLEAAARLGNATFADDVSWFLAVARQRSGRPDARAGFADLCRGKGHYAAAACAAVAQLDAAPAVPRQP